MPSSPLALWKACKNAAEVHGMREAYLRDGIAWAKWAAWLEEEVAGKKSKVSEWDAAVALTKSRSGVKGFAGFDAYDAISACGPRAAQPHYETPEKGSAILERRTPFLMDSGGQWLGGSAAGTVDTTRTVHFGKPTKDQRRAFTRVLQGHIAIDTAVFPAGQTTGATLDVLARRPLWQDGRDYLHGTGHGIGAFGLVHELYVVFSSSAASGKQPAGELPSLRPGMCISNEPGYYDDNPDNGFGVRTESVLVVTPSKEIPPGQGGKDWLRFERLTRVPIDTKLVEWSLLDDGEKAWLKAHNRQCKEELRHHLKGDKRALKWLDRQ